jgi:hypothetical protein
MSLKPEDLQVASRQTILGLDFYLTPKNRFAQTLMRAESLALERGYNNLFNISPPTFVLPDDFTKWHATAATEPDTIWISKPSDGARGEGIYLVSDIDRVEPQQGVILQQYIANPHLLDGYKYTLRFFVAVTSLDPMRAWVFPDGLTKLATQQFTTNRDSLSNRFVHLTNPDVLAQDKSTDFAQQRMTHTGLRERLQREGHDDKALFQEIHTLIAKSLLAVREPVLQLQNQNPHVKDEIKEQFMLLGYDILIDADMRPWIIEVNAGPSLKTEAGDTATGMKEQQIKEQVATETLILAGKLPKAKVQFKPLFPSHEMHEWLPCYEVLHQSDKADLETS